MGNKKWLIDDKGSVKCVFGRDSVMVRSWSGKKSSRIAGVWISSSEWASAMTKNLYVCSLIREKTRQNSWIVLTMIISICILWNHDMIWELVFQLFLNLSNSRNIFPEIQDLLMHVFTVPRSWKISELVLYHESLWISLNLLGLPKQRSPDPHLKELWVQKKQGKRTIFIRFSFGFPLYTVLRLHYHCPSCTVFQLIRRVSTVHNRSAWVWFFLLA